MSIFSKHAKIFVAFLLTLSSLTTAYAQESNANYQAESEFVERFAADILGYVRYDQDQFLIPLEYVEGFEKYLLEQKISDNGLDLLSYIYEVDSKNIVWTLPKPNELETTNYIREFNEVLITNKQFTKLFAAKPIKNFKPTALPMPIQIAALQNQPASQYLVAAQLLSFRETALTKRASYMYVTAKKI